MDNPVDHVVDLGLVNYVKHPSNNDYIVYRFADLNRANSFEEALTANNIWFEKTSEKGRVRLFYLFGVHKTDYAITQKINFEVEAKHKRPFIPNAGLRYLLLALSITLITLALMGYCKQHETLRSYDENSLPVNNTQSTD